MDVKVFMTFKRNEIMPVALVIAHKEILAMRRGQIFPILESCLNGR